jgi:hypothetical protein
MMFYQKHRLINVDLVEKVDGHLYPPRSLEPIMVEKISTINFLVVVSSANVSKKSFWNLVQLVIPQF